MKTALEVLPVGGRGRRKPASPTSCAASMITRSTGLMICCSGIGHHRQPPMLDCLIHHRRNRAVTYFATACLYR